MILEVGTYRAKIGNCEIVHIDKKRNIAFGFVHLPQQEMPAFWTLQGYGGPGEMYNIIDRVGTIQ